MRTETRRELVRTSAPLVVPLVREAVVQHYDSRLFERRAEKDLEILDRKQRLLEDTQAGKRVEASAPSAAPSAPETEPVPEEPAPATSEDDGLTELIASTECPVCQDILEELRDEPPRRRAKGLAEYGGFKTLAEQDSTESDLYEYLTGTEVLKAYLDPERADPDD